MNKQNNFENLLKFTETVWKKYTNKNDKKMFIIHYQICCLSYHSIDYQGKYDNQGARIFDTSIIYFIIFFLTCVFGLA